MTYVSMNECRVLLWYVHSLGARLAGKDIVVLVHHQSCDLYFYIPMLFSYHLLDSVKSAPSLMHLHVDLFYLAKF